mmetsp:Transcript_24496/g.29924  ORF Transcript_24496/g.29924 Transcript_24496/m.29924 type:complete len:491 (-) Transcript_24496:115-1587(-)
MLVMPSKENINTDSESELGYGYETFIPKWTKNLDERDLCMISLLQMLHQGQGDLSRPTTSVSANEVTRLSKNETDKDEEGTLSMFKKRLGKDNGKFFDIILDVVFNDMTAWMCMPDSGQNLEEKLLTLWRLGNGFQIISKCVYNDKINKELLAQKSKDSGVLKELINIAKWCNDWLAANGDKNPQSYCSIVSHCLLSACRVMTDLTDDCKPACDVFGASEMELVLDMLLPQSAALALEQDPTDGNGNNNQDSFNRRNTDTSSWSFDFALMLLGLLTNCVETHPRNRTTFGKLKKKRKSACHLIVDIFLRTLPQSIVQALKSPKQRKEEVDFDWNPEQLVISSYTSILLGCLMRKNRENKRLILGYIPGHSPVILIHVLRAFLAFQKDARVLTTETLVGTSSVISELENMLKVVTDVDANMVEQDDEQKEQARKPQNSKKELENEKESKTFSKSPKSTRRDVDISKKNEGSDTRSKKKKKRAAISWEDIEK